jgi:uncharacterized protein (TIGR00255 family)
VPQSVAAIEPRLRVLLQKQLARGRVELGISMQVREGGAPVVELNLEVARALVAAVEQTRSLGLIEQGLTAGDLLRLPQVVSVRERPTDPDLEARLGASVEAAVEQALADLDAMRAREGEHLGTDLEARRQTLAMLIENLRVAADAGRVELEQRLRERVEELGRELPADQAAIAQEIVRTAARSDVSEEVTRFRAHLAHWQVLVEGDEPCGRRLDFLLQEMNREINTIGSKADGARVSTVVIEAKAELERMREQVQNVE